MVPIKTQSLMRVRDRLWNKHKVSGDQAIYNEFKIVRNQIVSKIRYSKDLQSTKRNEILCNPKVASKKWWSTYKNIISQNVLSTIDPLMNMMNVNKVITDNLTKANLLNNFFVSQSTLDKSKAQITPNPPHSQYTINQKNITPLDVYTILVELDVSKATGPDQISNNLHKKAAVPISEPLSKLFNFTLTIGEFPHIWKLANVIPIFKKGDSKYYNNYRPISLLCCISKVFEKLIFNHIYSYVMV